jgi:hypothetical protein
MPITRPSGSVASAPLDLVEQNQIVAKRIANARASANGDVERTLHGLATRA